MKRNIKIISISLMIILTSIIIMFFEMKSYTPIDKDESGVIENYDAVTEKMNKRIKYKKELENMVNWQIKYTKELNAKADEYIKKYGIKKVLNPKSGGKHDEEERKILCEVEKLLCKIECGYHKELSPAVKFDFNGSGIKEIIGTANTTCGHTGCSLFIVQKQNGEYKNIFSTGPWTEPFPIIILNHKTNGYYDFLIITITMWGGRTYEIIQYDITKKKYDFTNQGVKL